MRMTVDPVAVPLRSSTDHGSPLRSLSLSVGADAAERVGARGGPPPLWSSGSSAGLPPIPPIEGLWKSACAGSDDYQVSSIAQASIPTGQEIGVLIIYILLGASTVLAPVAEYLAMGNRAATILGGWREWLAENNAVVTALLLLVFALVLIGKGITGLS